MSEAPSNHEPDPLELHLLTTGGRMRRLLDSGLSLPEAAAQLLRPESSDEYLERNKKALDGITERILSPEYLKRFEEIESEPDPDKKAKMRADLKRENYATQDMEALHRHISAQNRRLKIEGILPPDAPV